MKMPACCVAKINIVRQRLTMTYDMKCEKTFCFFTKDNEMSEFVLILIQSSYNISLLKELRYEGLKFAISNLRRNSFINFDKSDIFQKLFLYSSLLD